MVVRMDGFVKVIDALGGVEVNVESPIKYEDKGGKVKIALEAGKQVLDGEEALWYARCKDGAKGEVGDIARVKRQQEVLRGLLKRIMDWRQFDKLAKALMEAYRSIQTDLSWKDVLRIAW